MPKILLTTLTLILVTANVYAGTTSLITYYPPPVAAYNQLKLSTVATNNTCNNNTLGTIYADSQGSLHVCMNVNGTPTSVIYPQACYNTFCNTSSSSGCNTVTCLPNFSFLENNGVVNNQQTPDASSIVDTFENSSTAANNYTSSYICCSS